MKRKSIVVLCFIFVFLSLSACKTKDEKIPKDFSMDFKGITQEEVSKILGESSGTLFGSHGDVFLMENQTKITINYDNNGIVQYLAITDQEENEGENNFLTDIQGLSQEEVHKILGKPSSALHGARGDVYILENKTKITIYFDTNGMVNSILITNKDDVKTFTTE